MTGLAATALNPVARYLTLAKWIAIGLAAAMLIGGLWYAVATVKSWHRDALALPAVTAERDAAVKAKAEQSAMFAGTLSDISARLIVLEEKYNAVAKNQALDAAAVDRALTHFKEVTAHVAPVPDPGSADDLLIRRELLRLLANPDTGQLGRDSGGEGQPRAGLPAAAAQPDDVPGRPGAADHQDGAMVPAAGKGGRSGAKRPAQGRRRRSDRLGAKRTAQPAAAKRLGRALQDAVAVVYGPGIRLHTVTAEVLAELALKARKARAKFAAAARNGTIRGKHGMVIIDDALTGHG